MPNYMLWLQWGYGKAKTYAESAPKPSIEGHISTLFHKNIPLFVENRSDGAHEFFSGIKLACEPTNGYYDGIGPVFWQPISPSDFELKISGLSERTKKIIAQKVREYDRVAHEHAQNEINKAKEKEKELSKANKEAEARLSKHRKY